MAAASENINVPNSQKEQHLSKGDFANKNNNVTEVNGTDLDYNRQVLSNLFMSNNFADAIDFGNKNWILMSKDERFSVILGCCYLSTHQFNQALSCFMEGLKYHPNSTDLLCNSGSALYELKHFASAMNYYIRAQDINPSLLSTKFHMAVCLTEQKKFDEAIVLYEHMLSIEPKNKNWLFNLANIYLTKNKPKMVVKLLQRLMSISPQQSGVRNNLGIAYLSLGDAEMAKKCFLDEMELSNPTSVAAVKNYVGLQKITKDDGTIQLIERRLKLPTTPSEKAELLFSLGKAHDDCGEYDLAFKNLEAGNLIQSKSMPDVTGNIISTSDRIRDIFLALKDNFSSVKYENEQKKPIFIVGMPRSSSTLVEQIISNHSAAFPLGETTIIENIFQSLRWGSIPTSNSNLKLINDLYYKYVGEVDGSKDFITDKSLSNYLYVGFLLLAFPNAKIIHSKRDARATAWSIYKLQFGNKNVPYSYNLKDIIRVYKNQVSLMNFWEEHFPGKIFNLNYNNLTHNVEAEAKKIMEFCEISWEADCLKFDKNERSVNTASSAQVRQSIYTGSENDWRNYETHLKDVFKELDGY